MSRERRRPTREETHLRLLRGAAIVFAAKGIGASTIEDVCNEAGFSRGAFYSNFESKDELVLALLDFNLAENTEDLEHYIETVDIADFLVALDSGERARTSPLVGQPALYVELVMHAYRNPENRERLVDYQRRSFAATKTLLERIVELEGKDFPGGIDNAVALILAFDIGLSFNQLLDPDSYEQGQYGKTLAILHQLWTQSP